MPTLTLKTPKGIRIIGPGRPAFIIAELSGNHHQDFQRALALIDASVTAGVDAVKLQTYTPDTMTIDCEQESFQIKTNPAWKGKTLYQLYEEAHTPWEWQPKLKEYAEDKGILLFSTPFDETAVDFLERMDVELYKIASFETEDLELLEKIGKTKKPVILSRGLSSLEVIREAMQKLADTGSPEIAVLHCVSSYPATPDQMNLATIPDLAKRLGVVTGLSDHTLGTTVAVAAVALGANIVEKHVTLKRSEGGPDSAFSLEPDELKRLVADIRTAEQAIGAPTYEPHGKETENRAFRRSLFVIKEMRAGETFTRDNIRCIRPGNGLLPKEITNVLGKKAACDIKRGTPLEWKWIKP